jgi:hypothetical protein
VADDPENRASGDAVVEFASHHKLVKISPTIRRPTSFPDLTTHTCESIGELLD